MPEISNPNSAQMWVSDDGSILRCRKIAIGDWDMDTTSTKNVSWGFTLNPENIIMIFATIRDDLGTTFLPISYFINDVDPHLVGGGIQSYSSAQVALCRRTGGIFDNNNFDSTGYNRGYVFVIYSE